MDKIHLIMPMAGGGTRFANNGFEMPKPLIELQDKPFFYWAVQSVAKYVEVQDIIFVVLQEHVDKYQIDSKIHEYYPEAIIHVIPELLNGAVLTCCEGMKEVSDELPILFNDCDHAFICNSFYEFCNKGNFDSLDGAMLTFQSDSPKYSYVQFDELGNVIRTIEKQVVSNEAICGAYYFKNKDLFFNAVQTYLNHCTYKEFFVSGVYNEMAAKQQIIKTFPTDVHISFGTPDEYNIAIHDKRIEKLI